MGYYPYSSSSGSFEGRINNLSQSVPLNLPLDDEIIEKYEKCISTIVHLQNRPSLMQKLLLLPIKIPKPQLLMSY